MKKFLILVFILIYVSSVYAQFDGGPIDITPPDGDIVPIDIGDTCVDPQSAYPCLAGEENIGCGGIRVATVGLCYDCGATGSGYDAGYDGICPEDFESGVCHVNDPDCVPEPPPECSCSDFGQDVCDGSECAGLKCFWNTVWYWTDSCEECVSDVICSDYGLESTCVADNCGLGNCEWADDECKSMVIDIECGDGVCDFSEDCSNCEADCGDCAKDIGECGDTVCNHEIGEYCDTCIEDCGDCIAEVCESLTCEDILCEYFDTLSTCQEACGYYDNLCDLNCAWSDDECKTRGEGVGCGYGDFVDFPYTCIDDYGDIYCSDGPCDSASPPEYYCNCETGESEPLGYEDECIEICQGYIPDYTPPEPFPIYDYWNLLVTVLILVCFYVFKKR